MPNTQLKLSTDRKVSPRSAWYNRKGGKREAKPKIPNAFGLPAGDSCPGMTEFCSSCYAESIQKMYTNVDKLLWHNYDLLKACGANVNKMTSLLDEAVKSVNWRGEEKVFRYFWSGDLYSRPFTAAVAETCRMNPDVQFWLYTRSIYYVDLIVGISNLTVYLSVDAYNKEEAKKVLAGFPELMIAACGETWGESEEIMRDVVGRNAPRCPENSGKIPLVSEEGVGACVGSSCKMCVYGRNHVRFSVKKE